MPSLSSIFFRLASAFLVSVILTTICWRQLGRSVWIDEAMLLSNYPLTTIKAFISPLTLYDQAATPAYSFLGSIISSSEIFTLRTTLLAIISFIAVSILLAGFAGAPSTFIALLSLTAFSAPLLMLSEFKYYGLEVAGVVLSAVWYLKKNSSDLTGRDTAILISSMLLGVTSLMIV